MTRVGGRRRIRRPLVLVAAAAAIALVAGCGPPSDGGESSNDSTLRIAYPLVQSLDPRKASEPAQLLIATWPVYDRLIGVDHNSEYVPMLATSWDYGDQGKSLTLQLRKGVTFSDGAPFNASAVKSNLEWSKKAEGTALAVNVADINAVDIVNDHEVKLELAKPSTSVLAALASTLGGAMISPKALNSPDLGTKPVGTGAHVLSSFVPGQSATFKRRTGKGGIWDSATGKIDELTITTMDAEAAANALKSGQVDVATWSNVLDSFQSQIDQGDLKFTSMTGVPHLVGVAFNSTTKPFDNVKIRQAVNHAIDRDEIVKAFTAPGNPARVQPWPNNLPGYDKAGESRYEYDPAKARQLLQEAGFANGVDGGEMLVAQVGAMEQMAESVQANLAAVGIKIELRGMDVFALSSNWAKSKANAMLQYMSVPSIDPMTWMQRLFLNPHWMVGGPDASMQKLTVGLGNSNASPEQISAQTSKAVDYATEMAYYAPLFQGVGGLMSSSKVQNLDQLPTLDAGVADFRNVYLGTK